MIHYSDRFALYRSIGLQGHFLLVEGHDVHPVAIATAKIIFLFVDKLKLKLIRPAALFVHGPADIPHSFHTFRPGIDGIRTSTVAVSEKPLASFKAIVRNIVKENGFKISAVTCVSNII